MTGFEAFARLAAGQAVNCLLIGIAVAVLASLLLRFMARESSASRFAILYASLLVIVALVFWRGASAGNDPVSARAAITVSGKWATYLVAAWAAIALFGIARIARGLARLQRLRRSFVPLDHESVEPDFRGSRPATIYVSSQVRVPTALGFFRPAVVLPRWALNELSPEELRAAVLHELAHIDRWDDWTNLLQKIVRAVLFFHPAVWWIDSRLAIERELSCDDMVLVQSPNPRTYAECLVSLAEKSLLRRPLALAQAAVGKLKQTTLRVGRILNGRARKNGNAWKPALYAFGALSMLGFVAVEHAPRLIGFSDQINSSSLVARNSPAYQPLTTTASMPLAPASKSSGSRQHTPALAHRVKTINPQPRLPQNPATSVEARVTHTHNPVVVNASATESQTPQFVYFVFQTREFDGMGEMRVTTTVWRVHVPAQAQADKGTLPHST
jgi:beta-lactamase regulating signal transducer with metallopeptidase domain